MYSFTFNVRTAWNALDKLLETISPFPNWPNTVYPKLPYSPYTKLLQENCPPPLRLGKPALTKTEEFLEKFQGGGGGLFPIQVVSSYISSTPNTFVKILNFLEQI